MGRVGAIMNRNLKYIIKGKINHSGMTLIEIIVALAIVGIIAVGFLPMFSNGIKFLVNNGNQIKGMYTSQNTIEQKISQNINTEAVTMNIVFPDKTISIKGENLTIESYNLFVTKK